jgi:hypothetical protein
MERKDMGKILGVCKQVSGSGKSHTATAKNADISQGRD